MKKLLMMAALLAVFTMPAFAEDAADMATEEKPMIEQAMDAVVDTAENTVEAVEDATGMAAHNEQCTSETNEKIKLPENAEEAEKAQWQAAYDECVNMHGDDAIPATEEEAVE